MPAAATIRTFHHRSTSAASALDAKGERCISVCIPARDEAATVGPIVERIRRSLVDAVPLVDELVVLDDHSEDATARIAADAGATVVAADEVRPELALGPGKGQAMWKSLQATTGDLVTWCDADIVDFDERFVLGILGPLLDHDDIAFVKGFYDRPLGDDDTGGGRVTELVARPLVSLLFPHLAGLVQPLSGEYGGRRDVLESVPFVRGYGVELGLLIDVAARYGTTAVAQVDLGRRVHRNRSLQQLGPQAATILHTALGRAGVALPADPVLARPGEEPVQVENGELPPVADHPDEVRHTA
ncbi:glucosyl-3-phosphoglycerate synthase [Actinomarinicola tropica]|uniref:Glucosyl-3-phosphoglycerate synthase n=1 Tax=Actinomarinicola tropica TaxID=2789776 RepID=A0A5Q2RRD3_9ACTN|nr:glucosyl-3-phosphoglycerate synthase [Actinomarinicola tropica]QGG96460.1 glucosyl-3-phosphoglycerate synthase [Actinomarinicola tropica]